MYTAYSSRAAHKWPVWPLDISDHRDSKPQSLANNRYISTAQTFQDLPLIKPFPEQAELARPTLQCTLHIQAVQWTNGLYGFSIYQIIQILNHSVWHITDIYQQHKPCRTFL